MRTGKVVPIIVLDPLPVDPNSPQDPAAAVEAQLPEIVWLDEVKAVTCNHTDSGDPDASSCLVITADDENIVVEASAGLLGAKVAEFNRRQKFKDRFGMNPADFVGTVFRAMRDAGIPRPFRDAVAGRVAPVEYDPNTNTFRAAA